MIHVHRLEHHKGFDPLALDGVGEADHGALGHGRVAQERRLHVRGADAVAGHVHQFITSSAGTGVVRLQQSGQVIYEYAIPMARY
jgi:hypothetical protein